MGYVAVKIFFPGFTGGVKVQKTFQLLTLKLGRTCWLCMGEKVTPSLPVADACTQHPS